MLGIVLIYVFMYTLVCHTYMSVYVYTVLFSPICHNSDPFPRHPRRQDPAGSRPNPARLQNWQIPYLSGYW